jgi:hypothetical protein
MYDADVVRGMLKAKIEEGALNFSKDWGWIAQPGTHGS